MLNFYKLIEILVSLQSLVITSMLSVYIDNNGDNGIFGDYNEEDQW